MIYYRLALQERHTSLWTWMSTGLTSLNAVLQLLRSMARLIPPERIRVFSTCAKEDLAEMLRRENTGLASGSATAAQFLQERGIHSHAMAASEHDIPEAPEARENQGTDSSVVSPISPVNVDGLSLAEWWMRIPTLQVWATHTPPGTLPNESREAACSLNEGSMHMLERRRLELELGPGGDHDVPYTFALPLWMPPVLAWMRLLAQVRRGEVEL
jgi:hypothetical protein